MSDSTSGVPAELRFRQTGERQFQFEMAPNPEALGGRSVVFGGEILAKMIVIAASLHPGKTVKSIHGVFARAARHDLPLEFEVDPLQSGRAFGSDTVTLRQEGRVAARALVLLHGEEPDLVRHGAVCPQVPAPEASRRYDIGPAFPGTEQRVVGDADFRATKPVAMDPVLHLWMRAPSSGGTPAVNQALIAWNSVGMLIGTAMLPHTSINQTQAHRSISTGVLSHSLSFHEPIDAGDWLLFSQESSYAGRGRCHGRALIFARDGRLAASFTQDSMLRHFADGQGAARDARTAM